MKSTLLATLASAMLALSGCALLHGAGHEGHTLDGAKPCCKGEGKEGEMCPLQSKDGAAKHESMPCCAGKMPATPASEPAPANR